MDLFVRLYRDARSTKHKIIFFVIVWGNYNSSLTLGIVMKSE